MQLKERTFEPLVEDGEDTWLVQFYLSPSLQNKDNDPDTSTTSTSGGGGGKGTGGSKNLKAFASMWNEVAGMLQGIASVGAFDLGPDTKYDLVADISDAAAAKQASPYANPANPNPT